MKKMHSCRLFLSMFYTLLFLVIVGLCGCSGGGGDDPAPHKIVATIEVQPSGNQLALGDTKQFTLSNVYTDVTSGQVTSDLILSPVIWSSSKPEVATITSNGMATTVGAGTTVITADLGGGVTYTTNLTVPGISLVSIAITPSSPTPTIAINTSLQFTATGVYSDNTHQVLTSGITWISSDPSIATVGQDGKVTALAAGSAIITATSGGKSATAKLNSASLSSLSVTSSNPIIAAGTTQKIIVTGFFPDNTTQDLNSQVTWTSSNPSIVSIDQDGMATPHAAGSATITATSGGISASFTLTVTTASMISIEITSSSSTVAAGTTQQFSATGLFPDSITQNLTSQVTWSSSDPSIATIDQAGKVTPLAAGSTTITATFGSISVSSLLTVTPADLTGTWEGTYTIHDAVDQSQIGTYTFKFALNQSGTSVTGTSLLRYNTSGQISALGHFTEVNVIGSQINFVFSYNDPRTSLEMVNIGTATIANSSMAGDVLENSSGGYNCSYIFSLKKL